MSAVLPAFLLKGSDTNKAVRTSVLLTCPRTRSSEEDLTRLRIGNTIPNGGIDLLLGYSFRCVDLPIDRTVQRLPAALGKFDAPAGTDPEEFRVVFVVIVTQQKICRKLVGQLCPHLGFDLSSPGLRNVLQPFATCFDLLFDVLLTLSLIFSSCFVVLRTSSCVR
jgi:hypothetical protein